VGVGGREAEDGVGHVEQEEVGLADGRSGRSVCMWADGGWLMAIKCSLVVVMMLDRIQCIKRKEVSSRGREMYKTERGNQLPFLSFQK
jgi:hypothetical protein